MTAPPTPKVKWGQNRSLFESELSKGFKYQRLVRDFLEAHNIPCVMPRMQVRKSIATAHKFLNDPDLIAAGRLLEIKSRNLEFYRSFDLPSLTFLDTVDGWEGKNPKPLAYVVVSQISGTMLWTPGDSKELWATIRTHDRVRDIDVTVYAARRLTFAGMGSLVTLLREGPDAVE